MNIFKADLKPHNGNLISFSNKQMPMVQMPMVGTIRLKVTLGTWLVVVDMHIEFLVVKASKNAYNTILERTLLNKAKAIVSTLHLLMKFLALN